MKTFITRRFCVSLVCVLVISCVSIAADGVDLNKIDIIYISAKADSIETSLARILQGKLEAFYKIKPNIVKGTPEQVKSTIILGRKAALTSGMINEGELDAVKSDGYVIKAADGRIAVAGYAPQGTIYGVYALLRKLGWKWYPAHYMNNIDTFNPIENGKLEPFAISSKPFFTHRDICIKWANAGYLGASLRNLVLGNPREAANPDLFGKNRKPSYNKYKIKKKEFVDWFHTAGYLVPRDIYYETNPEYFSMWDGKRLPPMPYLQSHICHSNAGARKLSIDRTLEWIKIQKNRRVFVVSPADTPQSFMCNCPNCLKLDTIPTSRTDGTLNWVNSVAEEIKAKYPDKIVLTGAYHDVATVRPPIRETVASNLTVMYAPWFWESRATSSASFANPVNINSMKEFMGWCIAAPGQIGVFDYSSDHVPAETERIKFFAKNNVRIYHGNGSNKSGSMYHWINVQMLWDPLLDFEKLRNEFVQVYYGPAAEPMGQYLQLYQDELKKNCIYSRKFLRSPEFFTKAATLLRKADMLARKSDDTTRMRVLTEVAQNLRNTLGYAHPHAIAGDPEGFKTRLKHYVALHCELMKDYKKSGKKLIPLAKLNDRSFVSMMGSIGLTVPKTGERDETIVGKAVTAFDRWMDATRKVGAVKGNVSVSFDDNNEASKWIVAAPKNQKELTASVESVEITSLVGKKLRGVQIAAPLTKLPTRYVRKIKICVGRFHAQRTFENPWDLTGRRYLNIRLRASCDILVTFHVNSARSDMNLHAGEQIVRIDLENFRQFQQLPGFGRWAPSRAKRWDRKIKRIAFDIWPQDNFYPHPKTQDAKIVLLGMTAGNDDPKSENLPYRGKVIYLSQFRPNRPHEFFMPSDVKESVMLPANDPTFYITRAGKVSVQENGERFRSFTEHRAVTPIFAIVTGKKRSGEEEFPASKLQSFLTKMFGVKLPINPEGLAIGPNTGNVIIIGSDASLTAGRVTQKELSHVGPGGFAINSHNGRIAIAGTARTTGTLAGIERYLEDHRVCFHGPDAHIPDLSKDMLHELYILDWPYFRESVPGPARGGKDDVDITVKLAEDIKNLVRSGRRDVPGELIEAAMASRLSRYVAVRLLWDPFADSTRLIREFHLNTSKDNTKR